MLSGDIQVSIRLWKSAKVMQGRRYRVGAGEIEIEAVELIPFSLVTRADVRRSGEPDRATLRARAAHAGPIHDDTLVYRRRVPCGAGRGSAGVTRQRTTLT